MPCWTPPAQWGKSEKCLRSCKILLFSQNGHEVGLQFCGDSSSTFNAEGSELLERLEAAGVSGRRKYESGRRHERVKYINCGRISHEVYLTFS